MTTLGKILGLLSAILAAAMIAVYGAISLQTVLVAAGIDFRVIPDWEWFMDLMQFVIEYGLPVLLLLAFGSIMSIRSRTLSSLLFVVYILVAISFIVLWFFPDRLVDILR